MLRMSVARILIYDNWLENIVKYLIEYKNNIVSWFIKSITSHKNNKE